MPRYEYKCLSCNVEFEELLILKEDVDKYSKFHPCPNCNQRADRIVSSFAFNFKAPSGQTQGSGVHGNSGVHDLDYPTLDKAVGRSAAQKWSDYDSSQAERNKIRKESGSHALSMGADGSVSPMSKETAAVREKAMSVFHSSDIVKKENS